MRALSFRGVGGSHRSGIPGGCEAARHFAKVPLEKVVSISVEPKEVSLRRGESPAAAL